MRLPVALALLLAACANVPTTADEAYRRSAVMAQPGRGVAVIAPEVPFTVRGVRGVAGFEAVIASGKPARFYQWHSIAGVQGPSTEVSRAKIEYFRRRGASADVRDTSVLVRFPPQYFDGFLRRVDEVAR